MHPGLDELMEDGSEDHDERYIDGAKVGAAGYKHAYSYMTDDVEDEHPAWIAYFEAGEPSCALWEPALPDGDGWRVVAIYDTEDGPAAMFVRERQSASEEAAP